MGNASMSARKAITLWEGFLPAINTTSPVVEMGVDEIPCLRNSSATQEAVLNSWKESSGLACRSLRHPTTFGASSPDNFLTASRRLISGALFFQVPE
jgi:hypothetical protein